MTETIEKLKAAVADKISSRLVSDAEILWQDEVVLDGYVERSALVVNDGNFSVMRSWASLGNEPLLCTDLDVSYDGLVGAITIEEFPHAAVETSPITSTLHTALRDEHVIAFWANDADAQHIPFVAKSAAVGRSEELIAGSLNIRECSVDVTFRRDLSSLQPQHSRTMRM